MSDYKILIEENVEDVAEISLQRQPEFSFSTLPQHILVQIFHHEEPHMWCKTQKSYSAVCRSWNLASKHESIWKKASDTLLTSLREEKEFSPDEEPIKLENMPEELPKETNYKKFFYDLFKQRRKRIKTLKRVRNFKSKMNQLQDTITSKNGAVLRISTVTICILLLIAIVLFTVHDVMNIPSQYYPLTLIPIYAAGLLWVGICSMYYLPDMLKMVVDHTDNLGKLPMDKKLSISLLIIGFAITMLIGIGCVVMVTVNLSYPILPHLYGADIGTWSRRTGLFPWHLVMAAPILYISGVLFVVLTYSALECYRMPFGVQKCANIMKNMTTLIMPVSGVLGFMIMLGFHLEFHKVFHIALTFVPLYVAEVLSIVLCFSLVVIELRKTTNFHGFDVLLNIEVILLSICLLAAQILLSLYPIIKGYSYLGLLLPTCMFYMLLFSLVFKTKIQQRFGWN